MADDEILAVQARRRLCEFVRANPGFHLRELARATDLSITLADYHLRFLEKHELVSSAMDGEYKRFYPRDALGDAGGRPRAPTAGGCWSGGVSWPGTRTSGTGSRTGGEWRGSWCRTTSRPRTRSTRSSGCGGSSASELRERGCKNHAAGRSGKRAVRLATLRQPRREVLEERLVVRPERLERVRVDVDLADCGAVPEDRHDDLGAGLGKALQVSRVLRDVPDNDGLLRAGGEAADPLADRDPDVLGRVRAAPRLQNELLPLDPGHADPSVVRERPPELLDEEVEDRACPAPAPDHPFELLQGGVVVRLALVARHHLAELADALHRDRLVRRRSRAG